MGMSKWIKKGDRVVAIAGNEKGSHGVVLGKRGKRILIQGLNMRKKHMKKRSEETQSEIVSMEATMDISNVCLCDPDGNKLKIKVVEAGGAKELHTVKDGKTTLFRTLKKGK